MHSNRFPQKARIIFVGSVACDIAWPWGGGYSTTKAALVGACGTLRAEILANRLPIDIVLLKPGPVQTPMTTNLASRQASWAEAHLRKSPFAPGLLQSAHKALSVEGQPGTSAVFVSAENVATVICNCVMMRQSPQTSYLVASLIFTGLYQLLRSLPVRWTDKMLSKM